MPGISKSDPPKSLRRDNGKCSRGHKCWCAQAHFLYSVTFAIILSVVAKCLFSSDKSGLSIIYFNVTAGLTGLGAFEHDNRLINVVANIYLGEKNTNAFKNSPKSNNN